MGWRRRHRRGAPGLAVFAAPAGLLGLIGCGGDDDDDGGGAQPLIEEIAPAVAAVEAELDARVRYFEINATPQLVNLFVAGDDATTVTPYVYAGGELRAPGPTSPVSGGTPFEVGSVTDDLAAVLEGVTTELPDSSVSVFVIYSDDTGDPRYGATVVSDAGGVLDVDLGPDGEVLAADPRSAMPEGG